MHNKTTINIIKNLFLIISIFIYCFLTFYKRNQYIYNMFYSKCILFILLICFLVYIYGVVINKDKTYKTNIMIYISLFLILLLSVTFFIGRTEIRFYNWWYIGQYQPFHTIISQLERGSSIIILKNIIGNSIMIIPLSFLLMIKDNKYNSIFRQSIIILPIIISIELFQAFTHTGVFDIDDILLNYFGTVIFIFLITRFKIITKMRKLFYTDYKLNENIKYILFYISLIVLIIFMIMFLFIN